MQNRLTLLCTLMFLSIAIQVSAEEPAHIGSRRELFVDDWMIHSLKNARQELHHPRSSGSRHHV